MSSVYQRIKDASSKGMLFQVSLLPPEVKQIFVDLLDLVCQHENEINRLKDQIDSIRSSASETKGDIFKMKMAIENVRDPRIDSILPQLQRIENTQRSFQDVIQQNKKEVCDKIDEEIDSRRANEANLRKLYKEVKDKLENDYVKPVDPIPDFDIKVVDGEVEVLPLLRGLYRDSHRIDGLNEVIQSIRNDCTDVVDAMSLANENMHKFNHNIHELSLAETHRSNLETQRANYFQLSTNHLERELSKVWSTISNLVDTNVTILNIQSESTEQIQLILDSLSRRPVPILKSVIDNTNDVILFKEKVDERKLQFESERIKYHEPPYDDIQVGGFKVPEIQTKELTLTAQQARILPASDNSLLQLGMEELRTKFNELRQGVVEIGSQFDKLSSNTDSQIREKVDATRVDGIEKQVYSMMKQLSQRIDLIEAGPRLTKSEMKDAPPPIGEIRSVQSARRPKYVQDALAKIDKKDEIKPEKGKRRPKTSFTKVASNSIRHPQFD